MKIEIQETTTKQVELTVPCFLKSADETRFVWMKSEDKISEIVFYSDMAPNLFEWVLSWSIADSIKKSPIASSQEEFIQALLKHNKLVDEISRATMAKAESLRQELLNQK